MLSYRNVMLCTESLRQGSESYIPLLAGGSSRVAFSLFRVQTLIYTVYTQYIDVQQLTYAFLRKLYRKSWATHLLGPFLRGIYLSDTLSVHNIISLYDSIVHAYNKGCSGEYIVVYLKAVLIASNSFPCSCYEQGWNMYRQVYRSYSQVYEMYIQGTNKYILN